MANDRDKPKQSRDTETDERGLENPSQSDVVGRADEGSEPDADAEEFEDIDEADEDEDLEA